MIGATIPIAPPLQSVCHLRAPLISITPTAASARCRHGAPSQKGQADVRARELEARSAALQLAEQDALWVRDPDVSRPFASLDDAVDRLLPYHVRGGGEEGAAGGAAGRAKGLEGLRGSGRRLRGGCCL